MSEVSLRARKKAATMHRVQEIAVGMFEDRGFDDVTVEQVAAAADVSPSTIYRYFGTKEGLALHDEHDDAMYGALADLLATHDVWTAADLALAALEQPHFVQDGELTLRRTRLWATEPSLRVATVSVVNDLVDQLAPQIAASPKNDYSPEQARVLTTAVLWAAVSAIEGWYAGDRSTTMGEHLRAMIALLRPDR